jgi:uncharacterized protein
VSDRPFGLRMTRNAAGLEVSSPPQKDIDSRRGAPKEYNREVIDRRPSLGLERPAILTDEMRTILLEQRLGDIATVSPEGEPCLSPKGSLMILEDDTLVWADINSPRTANNISSHPRVEVMVIDPFARKGVRIAGKAALVPEDANYWRLLETYRAEGANVSRIRTVVAIVVDRAEVLRSPVYDTGMTEPELVALWQEYFKKAKLRTILDLIPPRDF